MANHLESQLQKNNNPRKPPPFFTHFHREADDLLGGNLDGDRSGFRFSSDLSTASQTLRSTVSSNPPRINASMAARYNFKNANLVARFNTALNVIRGNMFLHKRIGHSSETGISLSVPTFGFSKLYLSTSKQYGTIGMAADLNHSPKVTLQASLGTESLALGGQVMYLPHSRELPHGRLLPMRIGLVARNPSFTTATVFIPESETLWSSCILRLRKDHKLSTAIGICTDFRERENLFLAGGEWVVADGPSSTTILKATTDGRKIMKSLVHHLKDHNSRVAICAGLDMGAPKWIPQIFLSVESTVPV